MLLTIEELERLPVHFILCTERTGSSLLSLMLNINPSVLCVSEEPFAVFFYKRYRHKTSWTEHDLKRYVDEFWLMAEKNLDLFFSSKEKLLAELLPYKDHLSYRNLLKITYLQFLEPKSKEQVTCIIDKQIKYFFYLPLLFEIFPDARFCVLIRDVRDNVVSKSSHGLNSSSNAVFLSALWYFSYSNISFLKSCHKPFILLKYEDLAGNPEGELRKICGFFGIAYVEQMVKTEGYYERYLESRRKYVNPEFIEYLMAFQKSLYSGINTKKVGIYKNALSPETEAKILKLNRSLFDEFQYEYDRSVTDGHTGFKDQWQQLKAYIYRPLLLKLYLKIPFIMKLWLKKLRK